MNETLIALNILGFEIVVTGWKLIGWTGVAMFGGRWLVQIVASRRAGRPVVPLSFWYMSVAGSLMCLLYFIFGKNDSVGILNNLLPTAVAAYNLSLELKHRTRVKAGAEAPPPAKTEQDRPTDAARNQEGISQPAA